MSRLNIINMSFVSNGGKFKLYTVLNGLIFPTPFQPRISSERAIFFDGTMFIYEVFSASDRPLNR
jgi:hypothetical protein